MKMSITNLTKSLVVGNSNDPKQILKSKIDISATEILNQTKDTQELPIYRQP